MAQSDTGRETQYAKRLNAILAFFIIFGGLGMVAVIVYGLVTKSLGTCSIWTLACLICGTAVGFLFAIPKIVQGDKSSAADKDSPAYQLHVNTNLTEISDWLTKIIVGLTLVKLNKIQPYLTSLATSFSNGIGDKNSNVAMAFAYGTISYFSVLGFLFGYLFTRLYLSKTLSIADQDSLQPLKSLNIQLAAVESKQGFLTQSLTERLAMNFVNLENRQANLPQEMEDLIKMANDYLAINIGDWAERTRAKDAQADKMGLYLLNHHIDSQELYDYITGHPPTNEGLVLALATLINIDPQQRDAEILLSAGRGLNRLHVRYRVLLAIVTLVKKRYIDENNKPRAIVLVESYRNQADDSLLQEIASTLSFLNS